MKSPSRQIKTVGLVLNNIDDYIIPNFQTKSRWDMSKKIKLVDSILNQMPVPEFFVSKNNDVDYKDSFLVLDGQQRLAALRDFKAGKFSMTFGDIGKKPVNFSNLSPLEQQKFDEYNLSFQIIEGNDREIREVFKRLNDGTPLNKIEKRNIVPSELLDFIKDTVKTHSLFKKLNIKDDKRFAHTDLLQRLVLMLDKGFVSSSDKNLTKLLERYSKLSDTLKSRINNFLDLIDDRLNSSNINIIKKQGVLTFSSVLIELQNRNKNIPDNIFKQYINTEVRLLNESPEYAHIYNQGGYVSTIISKRAKMITDTMLNS